MTEIRTTGVQPPVTGVQPAVRPATHDDASVVDLLRDLTQQGSHLAQEQVSLVQAEMREGIDEIKLAIGALAGAAVVGIAGLGVVLMGLGLLLDELFDVLGLGTLLVGLLTLLVAYLMYKSGQKKLAASNLKPERSIRTAEHSAQAATGNLNETEIRHDR